MNSNFIQILFVDIHFPFFLGKYLEMELLNSKVDLYMEGHSVTLYIKSFSP